jgi:hypothetical protein
MFSHCSSPFNTMISLPPIFGWLLILWYHFSSHTGRGFGLGSFVNLLLINSLFSHCAMLFSKVRLNVIVINHRRSITARLHGREQQAALHLMPVHKNSQNQRCPIGGHNVAPTSLLDNKQNAIACQVAYEATHWLQ